MTMDDYQYDTGWRRTSAAIYARPTDGKVMGAYEVDVTEAVDWMAEQREQGHQLTLMHLVMSSLGRGLAEVPELNCYARWGRVVHRGDVVVATAVSVGGTELNMVRISQADRKSVLELAAEVRERVEQVRTGGEKVGGSSRGIVPHLPWPIRRWVVQAIRWLVFEAGLKLPGTGLSIDAFGSVLVTNVGSLGIHFAFPALMPAANLSFVVAMGKMVERPVYVDGQLVPRKFLPFGASFDHRIVDGAHIGRLQETFVRCMGDPRKHLT